MNAIALFGGAIVSVLNFQVNLPISGGYCVPDCRFDPTMCKLHTWISACESTYRMHNIQNYWETDLILSLREAISVGRCVFWLGTELSISNKFCMEELFFNISLLQIWAFIMFEMSVKAVNKRFSKQATIKYMTAFEQSLFNY